jgi:murein DD-endopeptidase MepM/ murein hydrolase activator NlpD
MPAPRHRQLLALAALGALGALGAPATTVSAAPPVTVSGAPSAVPPVVGGAQAAASQATGTTGTAGAEALAALGQLLELPFVPRALTDGWVRWQLGVRDVLRGASGRLDDLASAAAVATAEEHRVANLPPERARPLALAKAGTPAPPATIPSPATFDLTALSTSPIAAMSPDESSGFGWRDDPMRHDRRFHYGTDFRSKPGTPVLAAGAGVVVFAGRQGGYGNCVYLDHGGGVLTRYGHMRKITTHNGDAIDAGDQIGEVGSTGRSTGPHLHFEIRLDGRAVDPVLAMQVADIARDEAAAGRLAAMALSPELQRLSRDTHDGPRAGRGKSDKPTSRPGHGKRAQILW